jgi:hypothetical protein
MVDTRDLEQHLRERARDRMEVASDEVRRQIEHDAPRDTGRLATLIATRTVEDSTSITTKVTTEARTEDGRDYGKWQDEGTGVYIGRGRIYPKHGPVLKFFWPKIGKFMVVRSVKGTPPTHFFTRNVELWRDRLQEAFRR